MSDSFRALMLTQDEDADGKGAVHAAVTNLSNDDLPEGGDVLIAVDYSTLNYKDGLIINGLGKLVRDYPHIPGVDLAGTVISSSDDRYKAGDQVVATGWRMGEIWWGGHAQRARIKADWLVPLPDGMTTRQVMAMGTAGLTAVLSIMALEKHGLAPDQGDVLVTGAAGGVGSMAVTMLARRGFSVAAVTGRPETADYLTQLGASKIIPREDLSEPTTRPMESAIWAGCIDNVGGSTLSRVIGQMAYGASIASLGNAGGIKIETNVLPFILRGVNLLGIDSVMQPYENRVEAWQNAAKWMDLDNLDAMVTETNLEAVPEYARAILKGQVKGRVLVNPNA